MSDFKAVLASTIMTMAGLAAPAAVAGTYDYSGVMTFCTTTCNGFASLGGPGGSANATPSEVTGSVVIDVEPGDTFDSTAIQAFQFEIFNPAIPLEPFDGTNQTSANPLPVVATISGVGATDADGALVSGELAVEFTQPPLSANFAVLYLDLSDGSGEGLLFTDIVRFLNFEGWFTLRPPPDADGDGVQDAEDNCLLAANPPQRDSNGDGFGNLCDADLNDDCATNAADLGLFRQAFFGTDADADLNGDGVVNSVDLGIMRALYFAPPGPSALASCP